MGAGPANEGISDATRHFLNGKSFGIRNKPVSLISIPNSRNCTKHNCRCDYMDIQAARDESTTPTAATTPPNLMITPEIDAEIEQWRTTGVPPFPELNFTPRSDWHRFSKSTLRLIYHIAGLSIDFHRRGLGETTVWSPHILRLVRNSFRECL